MTVRRLVMVRHGQTDFNLGSRMQGQLDTELSEVGRAQARAAAGALDTPRPLRIVSSDLRPACGCCPTSGCARPTWATGRA
jgi:probable phosphoglycerate mutase